MGGALGDWQPITSAELIAEILELADRLRSQLDEPCEAHGISASRFAVMGTIHDCGSDGCSQTELAARLQLSDSNVSVLVEALRKSGLLFRFRSKTDRRRSVLLLSETGIALVTALEKSREVVAASLVEGIGSDEINEMRRLLKRLDAQLARSASSPSASTPTRPSSLRRAS